VFTLSPVASRRAAGIIFRSLNTDHRPGLFQLTFNTIRSPSQSLSLPQNSSILPSHIHARNSRLTSELYHCYHRGISAPTVPICLSTKHQDLSLLHTRIFGDKARSAVVSILQQVRSCCRVPSRTIFREDEKQTTGSREASFFVINQKPRSPLWLHSTARRTSIASTMLTR
jgi:hypothetical protein